MTHDAEESGEDTETYSSDDTAKFDTVIDTHKLQQLLRNSSAQQLPHNGGLQEINSQL